MGEFLVSGLQPAPVGEAWLRLLFAVDRQGELTVTALNPSGEQIQERRFSNLFLIQSRPVRSAPSQND